VQVQEVRGKRYSVLGAARSGLAVSGLLVRQGASVFVSDSAPPERMARAQATLEELGIPCEFGGNSERVLDADVIVLSPGVPSSIPIVEKALHQSVRVVSELEVASWFCRGPILAITGTNGKTTTTTLAGRMLEDAGLKPIVAGNIGIALSEVVGEASEDRPVVLEVSSFQLDHCETFAPHVSILLNITPDHLDRYDHSFEKYIASKARIFEKQKSGDALVFNADDEITAAVVRRQAPAAVRLLPFGVHPHGDEGAWVEEGMLMTSLEQRRRQVLPVSSMSLRGLHNHYNAMAAALSAQMMGVPTASIRATLKNFRGVEHRLEVVRELNGVTYVNDSKATNVDSVWYALQSFESPLIVLMGGRDKGNDYGRLQDLVRKHVQAIVAIGESASKVVTAFAGIVPVATATTMEEAVRVASRQAVPGNVVLLSPACASFDWFDNYEHRGRVFKTIVMAL
jgi:UDP-N-acetylmuramoylalanine--D-glutamate ligase